MPFSKVCACGRTLPSSVLLLSQHNIRFHLQRLSIDPDEGACLNQQARASRLPSEGVSRRTKVIAITLLMSLANSCLSTWKIIVERKSEQTLASLSLLKPLRFAERSSCFIIIRQAAKAPRVLTNGSTQQFTFQSSGTESDQKRHRILFRQEKRHEQTGGEEDSKKYAGHEQHLNSARESASEQCPPL